MPPLASAAVLLGRGRTLVVFAIGHIGASLGVAGLVAAGALPVVLADRVRVGVDTGPSYGTAAAVGAGLLVASVRAARAVRSGVRRPSGSRVRPGAALAVVAVGVVALIGATVLPPTADPRFTDWGHLLARATGGALGLGIARQDSARGPATR